MFSDGPFQQLHLKNTYCTFITNLISFVCVSLHFKTRSQPTQYLI